MQTDLDGLLHDAASLRGFILAIVQFCEEHERSQTYLDSTYDFLGYVSRLGNRTVEHLQALIDEASRFKRWVREYRQKLVLIKRCWALLHSFVKPAADAHTLRIPVAFLQLLEDEIRTIPQFTKSRIVPLLSSELNYFQHRHTRLKRLGNELRSIIPNAEPFPEGLGFIAIPYSQGSSVFANVLIYHEAAHFVAEELSRRSDLSSYVAEELSTSIYESLKMAFGHSFENASERTRSWCSRLLARWCEEIYCDLFAIHLVGPAFTFAAVELFDLMGLLSEEEEAVDFSDSHPADACRFKEHVRILKSFGWWPSLVSLRTEQAKLVAKLAGIDEGEYSFSSQEEEFGSRLIKAFLRVRSRIRTLVKGIVGRDRSERKEFVTYNSTIRQYLNHGVVPSTVVFRNRLDFPTPIAVINAAFFFYLQGLPGLSDRLTTSRSAMGIKRRSELQAKVQMWTMKALEDHRLLRDQQERV